jgi:hypothetical protein
MPLVLILLAATAADILVRSIAVHEEGTAIEMPCVAPPTRVYPAGMAPGELDAALLAALLAAGLLAEAALDADPVSVAEAMAEATTGGLADTAVLPHAVTAAPVPITESSARPATLMFTFTAFTW